MVYIDVHGRSGVGWCWWFAVFGGCVVSSCLHVYMVMRTDVLEGEGKGEGVVLDLRRLAASESVCST